MDLSCILRRFRADDSGAVTVDWVVLTGSIVLLGIIVMYPVGDGINSFGSAVATDLTERSPAEFAYQGQ